MDILDRDYWFKVVDMLQQNWALIDNQKVGATVWFITDTSRVFDSLSYSLRPEAVEALERNGFTQFADNIHLQQLMTPPRPPFVEGTQPNGAIYSSGRFWH